MKLGKSRQVLIAWDNLSLRKQQLEAVTRLLAIVLRIEVGEPDRLFS